MKPPITYYGGKILQAERIASLLPEHRHYVEPYCGSLAVLLAKARGDDVGAWREYLPVLGR